MDSVSLTETAPRLPSGKFVYYKIYEAIKDYKINHQP